jgi:alpha-glucosidase
MLFQLLKTQVPMTTGLSVVFKTMIVYVVLFAAGLLLAHAQTSVLSPDGRLSVTVTLNSQLTYAVAKDGVPVISSSPLGIKTNVADFTSGLTFVSSGTSAINENYSLPSGKRSDYINQCNELTVRLRKGTVDLHVIFRAYNEGFAYRYYIPGTGSISVDLETSGFAVSGFSQSWGMKYKSSYEDYFPARDWVATSTIGTFCAPVLTRSASNIYCLITEAANYGSYSVSKLRTGAQTGLFTLEQTGLINTTRPLETPWRAVLTGSLPQIVESVMIENLNPPSSSADVSWIKPGRASWDWGGEEGKPVVSVELSKKYIDLSAAMGWEYFMQDDGWDKLGFNLQEVINYGNSKGVGVLLWSHHNRFQNNTDQIRTILQQWKTMGIKGVKVDFWEDDGQAMIQKYDKLMQIAGELKLLVNVHGCTKPSGTRRKWPHLLTSEAVLGGEYYLFNTTMTPAHHNISLALTRNVIGPMDYTPLDFAHQSRRIKQTTTWSHQLALGVVFESGIQHMNDSPENYGNHISTNFLKTLPAAWSETKCLEASPDQFITVARRSGNDWYVGSLCNDQRTVNIDLSFLNSGVTYYANIYKDGICDSEIALEQRQVTKGQILSIPLRARGGVSIHLSTLQTTMAEVVKYEAEAAENVRQGSSISNDARCSNGKFVGFIGNGNTLAFKNINAPASGDYLMTLYYMTGETRNGYIKVNDQSPVTHNFVSSSSFAGNGLAYRTFTVSLAAGLNTIEFGNATGWSINIDRITINTASGGTTLPPLANGTYQIQNKNSKLFMDVFDQSVNDGAKMIQWASNGQINQQFDFEHVGNGYYKVTARHSGKSWDVEGASHDDGKKLIQWTYTGGLHKQFLVIPVGDGHYKFVARHSGKIMHVAGGSMNGGAEVQQATDKNQTGGQWKLIGSKEIEVSQGAASVAPFETVDIGDTELFSDGGPVQFMVSNIGYEDLNLNGSPRVVLSGEHADDFTVASEPASVVAGSNATDFTVTFKPSASGARMAELTIPSDDADESAYVIKLVGEGLKLTQSLSFDPVNEKTFGDEKFTLNASSSSGLPVAFTSSDPEIATIEGNAIVIKKAGTVTISATQSGNDTFNTVVVERTLIINKAAQAISFNPVEDKTFGNEPFELSAVSASGLPISYVSSDTAIAVINANTVEIKRAGSLTITAFQSGNENYHPAEVQQVFTIRKAAQAITVNDIEDKLFTHEPFGLTTNSSAQLPVEVSIISGPATVIDNKIVLNGSLGTVTVKLSQSGDDNYEPVEVTKSFNVICLASPPQVLSASRCGAGKITLSASGGAAGNYRWYLTPDATEIIADVNNGVFETELTESRDYYVSIHNVHCESERVVVRAEIKPIPAPPVILLQEDQLSVSLVSDVKNGTQWFKDGVAIAGANSSTYVPGEPGIYTATVTSANNCISAHSIPQELIVTDLEEAPGSLIKVFPNPVSDQLFVDGSKMNKAGLEVMLFDVTGKVLKTTKGMDIINIDMHQYSAGTFFLNIYDGKRVVFKRVVRID